MTDIPRHRRDGHLLYRITVEGVLDPAWALWLEAERVESVSDGTCLAVAVTDQSGLHGLLRRIHDLHLSILRLERADLDDNDSEGE
jgi:hypothetical protein